MNNVQKFGAFGIMLWLVTVMILAVLTLIGYFKNVIWLFTGMDMSNGADAIEILSIVGVVLAPLGGVMGWLH